MSKRAAFVIASLTTILAIQSSASQKAESKKPSNSRQMRCVVKATADAEVVPLSFELVESLLRSDAVEGKATRTAWPPGHRTPDSCLDIQPLEDFVPSNDAAPSPGRTLLFGLHVRLSGEVDPVAKEFGDALIENLHVALQEVFAAHAEDLANQLSEAESRREAIRTELEDMFRRNTVASPQPIQLDSADETIHKQLQTVVDLSAVTQQTSAGEAFDILRNSVQPPLNLIVIWRDLLDNANIEPSSPAELDGPANVQLGTALRNLLDAISDPLATGREYRVDYVVTGGAITVATRIGLPQKKLETRVYDLPPRLRIGSQAPELAALIRETIEPESWQDLHIGLGNGTIATSAEGRLIVSQSRDVHIKIVELLSKVTADCCIALPGEASQETLAERLEFLLSYRKQLEQELDRLQERQGQLARERNEEQRKAADAALHAAMDRLYAATHQLKQMQADMAKAKSDDPGSMTLQQAIQKLDESMNHCRQVSPGPFMDLGGWILPPQGTEERTVEERIAAKQSNVREVGRRIAETQRMMTGSKTFDAELSRIQWTARRLDDAEARVCDLKTRIENLRPCTVAVIGGTE